MVESGMRTIYFLSQIPGSETCLKFHEFLTSKIENGKKADIYREIVKSLAEDRRQTLTRTA